MRIENPFSKTTSRVFLTAILHLSFRLSIANIEAKKEGVHQSSGKRYANTDNTNNEDTPE